MAGLLWFIVVLLVIAWFFGFAVNVGWWIHVLLVLALLGVIYQLVVRPILLAQTTRTADTHTHETHVHRDNVVHEDVHRDVHDDHVHRDRI